MALENYWNQYPRGDWPDTTTGSGQIYYPHELTGYGYPCPKCGCWVNYGESHCCYISPWTVRSYYPCLNKTEEAYKILKALVEKKIIQESDSYKKFCELIEEIAKAV